MTTTFINLRTLSNRTFATFCQSDAHLIEDAVCDEFRCQPESVSFDDDEDGEHILVNGERVGRIQQVWR